MKILVPFNVLRALVEYLEMEHQNILTDMEHKGILEPVLSWAVKEGLLEAYK